LSHILSTEATRARLFHLLLPPQRGREIITAANHSTAQGKRAKRDGPG